MKQLLKPFQLVYWLYAVLLFVAIMLLIFPFVIAFSFLGRIKGGNLIYKACMLWSDTWFALVFIRIKRMYEAPHDKHKQFIFVSNHISYLDAAIIVKAYRQPIRPLGKVEMARVPVFGYIYEKAIVTVDRSDAESRAKSVRLLVSILSKGISVLVFPEGTFNITHGPLKEFYDGAFRVAIETQTAVKPVLFLDAYARMNYKSVFSLNPGRCRIVYLDEIPVAGLTVDDITALKERVYLAMDKKLRQYNASWIA
jgi:1-acyl-sn-glycerol-3-phosphate acyltransferase